MKKIEDILLMADGTVIDQVQGKIIEVFKPSDPSPGQQKVGIHNQDILIEGQTGKRVKVQIKSAGMHLKPADKGKLLTLASTDGDRGQSGVAVSIYKAEGKEPVFRIDVSKWASMSLAELGAKKETGEAREDPRQPGPSSGGVTLNDHVDRMKWLLDAFQEYFGDGEYDCALRAATTVYIQTCDRNTPVRFGRTAPPAASKPAEEKPKATPSMSKEDAVTQVLRSCIGNAAAMTNDDASRILTASKATWEDVYDEVVKYLLARGIKQTDIDQAHDDLRASVAKTNGAGDETFYKAVVTDYQTFLDMVSTAEATAPNAVQTTSYEDDSIPF